MGTFNKLALIIKSHITDNNPVDKKETRRKVLKGIGGIGAGSVLTGSALSSGAAASDCADPEPDQTWAETASKEDASGKDEAIYLSTSVGSLGASWDSDWNVWQYKMKQDTVAKSEYASGGELNALVKQRVRVSQGTLNSLAQPTGDCYLGARPTKNNPTYDYSNVALALAHEAISALGAYASYSVSAADLVSNYLSGFYDEEGNDYEIDYTWDYGPSVYGEFSNYMFFEAWSNKDETNTFTLITDVLSNFWNQPEVRMSFDLPDGLDPRLNPIPNSTITSNELTMINSVDKNGYDWKIERIPADKVRRAISRTDIVIRPEKVKKHEREGRPLYWAHNPPISLKSSNSNLK